MIIGIDNGLNVGIAILDPSGAIVATHVMPRSTGPRGIGPAANVVDAREFSAIIGAYLRSGRKLRATGTFVATVAGGFTKVKPNRSDWGTIILTPEEIEAGKFKPPTIERKKSENSEPRQKREKPAPIPNGGS